MDTRRPRTRSACRPSAGHLLPEPRYGGLRMSRRARTRRDKRAPIPDFDEPQPR